MPSLFAAAVIASFYGCSLAKDPELGGQCQQNGDDGPSGADSCGGNVGDEIELLQARLSADAKQSSDWSMGTKKQKITSKSHGHQFDAKKARVFAALSKLTYCSANLGTAGSAAITCGGKGYCKDAGVKVMPGSVRTIAIDDGDSKKALVAYVSKLVAVSGAKDGLKPGCAIAIRGTYPGTNNGGRNMQASLVPLVWGDCTDCKVYEGHQEIWKQLMPFVLSSLKSAACPEKGAVYLTGHSMGGSVAAIGMYALASLGWDVQPGYSFHSPRTFNEAAIKNLQKMVGGSEDAVALSRITYSKDEIPSKPTRMDYSWPEVHIFEGNGDTSFEMCWAGSSDCGIRKYKELCSQSECEDHLVDPLAPDSNLAMFKNFQSTCVLGLGTVKAGTLPKSHRSAEEQLKNLASTQDDADPEDPDCIDGWKMAPDCVKDFIYLAKSYTGCTTVDTNYINVMGMAWCSLDYLYASRWNTCYPCGKKKKAGNMWGR